MQPSDVRSMCCRLRLDLRELRKEDRRFLRLRREYRFRRRRHNQYAENCLSGGKMRKTSTARLDHMMDIAARSLRIKREVITKLLDNGLYPYTKQYLGTFANHFSTIGLLGMNEAGLNARWLRKDMTHEETQTFTKDVLNHMRERLADYQELYGDLYNLEATPAESTSYRLAKHDRKRYPDIITAGEPGETPYYTNSSHLPVGYTTDIFDALDVQDEIQTLYTSGTVFHAFLGEKLPDWKSASKLVRTIAAELQTSVLYIVADLLYLQGSRLSDRGAFYLSCLRQKGGGIQPVLPVTTVRYRTGTKARHRNIKTESLTISHAPFSKTEQRLSWSRRKAQTGLRSGAKEGIYLFTTKTCPNCRMAKEFLKDREYEVVDAEENPELSDRFGIMQAPTLVQVGRDGEVKKYVNASNIRRFVEESR